MAMLQTIHIVSKVVFNDNKQALVWEYEVCVGLQNI